jgi:SAM-dependent methyltransferase
MSDGSVVFDRAAGYYDQTRNLPADTAAAQTALLREQLAGLTAPVLEIGVGTGRIAVPIADAGLQVLGVDLSAQMLARLAAKQSPVAAARASATRLPLADDCAGAVIACHVLHLIPDWRQVIAEVERVLQPGGLLLATRGRRDGSAGELQRRLRAAAGVQDAGAVGLDNLDGLDELMRERGATVTWLPPVFNSASRTAAEFLDLIENGTFSWTWPIPEDRRRHAVAEVRSWLSDTRGDPAQVVLTASPIQWRSYRLP